MVVKTVATQIAMRGLGLGGHMLDLIRQRAHTRCGSVIHALIHVNNLSLRMSARHHGRRFRRYALYQLDAVNANIAARLAERAQRHPDRLAIAEARGRPATFGELAERVAALAAGLEGRGVRAGTGSCCSCPCRSTSTSRCWRCSISARWPCSSTRGPVAGGSTTRVKAARPRAFLGTLPAQLLRLSEPALRAVPLGLVVDARWCAARALDAIREQRPPAVVGAETAALVTFTTGSTGRPKAAARSHGFLWAQHRVLAHHLGLARRRHRPADAAGVRAQQSRGRNAERAARLRSAPSRRHRAGPSPRADDAPSA